MNDNAIDDQFHFNPRSLAGATLSASTSPASYPFQSTLPCGSDLRANRSRNAAARFQSTLPCGSDPIARTVTAGNINFNPRSLAGATGWAFGSEDIFLISIHAPLRERRCLIVFAGYQRDFNPRSLAGATFALLYRQGLRHDFNPRSLAGATVYDRVIILDVIISIHAPLRERRHCGAGCISGTSFQSTLPCGSDEMLDLPINVAQAFQSTLPCGSDYSHPSYVVTTFRISIHAPLRERRNAGRGGVSRRVISIHAPLRERPAVACNIYSTSAISIHAPLRERRACCAGAAAFLLFQSTLPCGSDSYPCLKSSVSSDFNPRSLAGATSASRNFLLAAASISIHAPLRERP